MNIKVFIANFFFIACCFPIWIKFWLGVNRVSKIQNKILKRIIKQNQNCKYGREHNFSQIKTYNDWKNKVPIIEYDDIEKYIKDKNALTSNIIKVYEPTSGSSGFQKLIPYTEELRKEFQNGIKVWIFDLYLHNPILLFYKSYWSISPKTKTENSDIGFEKDEEYFSKIEQTFLNIIMVQPDLNGDFCKNTKEKLIEEKDNIGLISIWSPTFLPSILNNEIIKFENLKIISCWSDASSKTHAYKLIKDYPQAKVQPKGLLATEGITSFPLWNKGCVLSYQSHFYEFMDENGSIYLLNELKQGKIYTVILTTSGGLYRYNTHDLIRVFDFYKNLPVIEFIGRDNNVSDFFGEKLSEKFVNNVFTQIFPNEYDFAVLSFKIDHYVLYTEQLCEATILEEFLQKNYHYKNCIELGQLKTCTVKIVKDGLDKYQKYYLQKGLKLGDIKVKTLDNNICGIFDV